MAIFGLIVISTNAQIYRDDEYVPLPTADLYDSGMMSMYMSSLAQTAVQRKHEFEQYMNWAYQAYCNAQWADVVTCINYALSTNYWNSDAYYYRGRAYENMGYYSSAKKDYKRAKRKGNRYAAGALESLKDRMKYNK